MNSSNDMSFGMFLFWSVVVLGIFAYIAITDGKKVCTNSPQELEYQLKMGGCSAYKGYFDKLENTNE